jgi:sarcosine oxidase, subunit gamma
VGNIILKPLNALLGSGPCVDTIGAVTISETVSVALASLATRRGQADHIATVAKGLGLDLPGPGHASASTPYSALWLGPDQWLIMAAGDADQDIAAALEAAFGPAASITEQTGGWVCLLPAPDYPRCSSGFVRLIAPRWNRAMAPEQ